MAAAGIERYREAQARALGPRGAEAAAFAKAAALLEGAGRDGGFGARARALRFNQVLWTMLQADLARGRRLPERLRGDLLSLSLFVDRETVRALALPGPGGLAALVEINRTLARGLGGGRAGGPRP